MPQAAAAPQTAAPVPPAANDQGSVLDRVLGHFTSPRTDAPSQSGSHVSALAKSALPIALMAARRVPIGLAVLGVAAAGIALANPTSREKIFSAGRKGLEALRR